MNKKHIIIISSVAAVAAAVVFSLFSRDIRPNILPSYNVNQQNTAAVSQIVENVTTHQQIKEEVTAVSTKPEKKKSGKKVKKLIVKDLPQPTMDPDNDELEYEQNQFFEELVMGSFPVHTVQTYNPMDFKTPGPPKNEIWIRIKPENAKEMNEVMGEVADLYREIGKEHNEDIVVMHWVGAQPYARRRYSPDGSTH